MSKKYFFIINLLIFFSINLHGKCNFNTSNYIDELSNHEYLLNIDIRVINRGKYEKNFLETLIRLEDQWNIPNDLKKKYKAKITVKYKFGLCEYLGFVRQTGDLRDHIDFSNTNKPIRSLKVTLDEGNIMNAVKFKLLIPKTRNELNEILGTIIFNHLGFLAPETFMAKTTINGINSLMIFQEDTRKEFLERNKRREGPIFEGDETLLWSDDKHKPLELWPLSLSRMNNKNWMLKEESTKEISIKSFLQLQTSYLEAIKYNKDYKITSGTPELIFPNLSKNNLFQDFTFLMLAMNGSHGLKIGNRKYYYNSFINGFEPIYYDGDLNFYDEIKINNDLLNFGLNRDFKSLINKINEINKNKTLLNHFKRKSLLNNKNAKTNYDEMVNNFIINSSILLSKIENADKKELKRYDFDELINSYIVDNKLFNHDQNLIIDLTSKNNDLYEIDVFNQEKRFISNKDLISIVGENILDNQRFVLLKNPSLFRELQNKNKILILDNDGGYVEFSNSLNLKINNKNKEIIVSQNQPQDWIIFKNAKLVNWDIIFKGIKSKNSGATNFMTINSGGLTGCLNFYNSNFEDTNIDIYGGGCEDSLNIVKSTGHLNELNIADSFSDALDADFSDLSFKDILINNAGNDCIDLSGGIYYIKNIKANNCKDKGVSVGEQSIVYGDNFKIQNANYGVSSKDYSKVFIKSSKFNNTNTCFHAAKKKQEFGGGYIEFDDLKCLGNNVIDNNSSIQNSN